MIVNGYEIKRGADLIGADLTDADLIGADLTDADLSWIHLRGANLSRANLREVNLSKADLSRANLSEVDLSGANLSGADLSESDLREADLTGADLTEADLTEADLRGINGILVFQLDRRGYQLVMWKKGNAYWFNAGCRSFSYLDALKYWGSKDYPNETRGNGYCNAIKFMAELGIEE